MTDPFLIVHEGCYLGFRFQFRISDTPTGNLRLVEGVYGFAALGRYHPLEATLVGVTASGDWLSDVATAVGVDPAWVMGFLDGFLQATETSRGWDYSEGYQVAEELRVLRYREKLPDRGERCRKMTSFGVHHYHSIRRCRRRWYVRRRCSPREVISCGIVAGLLSRGRSGRKREG